MSNNAQDLQTLSCLSFLKRKYTKLLFVRILLTQPDSFPPSSSWHQMLRKNVNVALVDYLYQEFYALNSLYGTFFWLTNEISKRRCEKCITKRAEWTSSSVLHCNVTVTAWRRENTRDVGAASKHFGKLAGDGNRFPPKCFDPDRRPPNFILYFNTLRLDLHSAGKLRKWQCQV